MRSFTPYPLIKKRLIRKARTRFTYKLSDVGRAWVAKPLHNIDLNPVWCAALGTHYGELRALRMDLILKFYENTLGSGIIIHL